MVHVQRTFTVNQPVDVVVDYLKDFSRAEQWDPGTQSCIRVGTGPVEVGTTWENVSKVRGRDTTLKYRLERLEPHRLTFVGKNKTATSTDDMTFTALQGETQIQYDSNIVFNGIAKLADPFMRREFEKLGDETVRDMTRVLDGL
ncbi:MAG TPA: SRPBCC family protein [Frankiaceae bacterium]|nr:SRPBCC family protein [Frankiaceae bacterium]